MNGPELKAAIHATGVSIPELATLAGMETLTRNIFTYYKKQKELDPKIIKMIDAGLKRVGKSLYENIDSDGPSLDLLKQMMHLKNKELENAMQIIETQKEQIKTQLLQLQSMTETNQMLLAIIQTGLSNNAITFDLKKSIVSESALLKNLKKVVPTS